MRLVRQPENSSLCGQACVATIAGIPLNEAIKIFGSRGGTKTKQIINALHDLGIKCGDKLIRLSKVNRKTPTCIVRLHFAGYKNTHWVVYHKKQYHDPAIGILDRYIGVVRETSYLPVYPVCLE